MEKGKEERARTAKRRACIWLAPLLLVAAGICSGANPEGSRAQALIRSSASIVLDGRLDEPAWKEASVLRLTQQSPNPGGATPFGTEVRVIVASERIYFGF